MSRVRRAGSRMRSPCIAMQLDVGAVGVPELLRGPERARQLVLRRLGQRVERVARGAEEQGVVRREVEAPDELEHEEARRVDAGEHPVDIGVQLRGRALVPRRVDGPLEGVLRGRRLDAEAPERRRLPRAPVGRQVGPGGGEQGGGARVGRGARGEVVGVPVGRDERRPRLGRPAGRRGGDGRSGGPGDGQRCDEGDRPGRGPAHVGTPWCPAPGRLPLAMSPIITAIDAVRPPKHGYIGVISANRLKPRAARPIRRPSVRRGSCPTTLRPTTAATIPASSTTLATAKSSVAGRHRPRDRERGTHPGPNGVGRADRDGLRGHGQTDHAGRQCDDEHDGGYGPREAVGRSERRGPDRFEHGAPEQNDPGHRDTTLRPTTQPMSSRRSAARRASRRSWPRAAASRTVQTAPMPTHTAYEVPVGRPVIAQASPPILATSAHCEDDGRQRATEAVRSRESRGPDGLEDPRDDEDEPVHDVSSAAVLSLGGYGSLVREGHPAALGRWYGSGAGRANP